ncbi:serine hydrolase domain-containing protein [Nocardia stercoris]|uniref:serine hydrolase domain-containing protein n=1 Tax=Nocardia stercoris TaxID=2483361 RepID=UPI001F486588|nr:serine hydrolase domain-containing protein [Nocardia stercoris]
MRIVPAVSVLALLVLTGCSSVPDSASGAAPTTAVTVSPERVRSLREDIDALVRAGATGAIATLTENGQTLTVTSGVADRSTGAPMPAATPQQVRIGSVSKVFAASVLLQLVSEGRIRLDDSVDTYLPGLLTGDGVDGKAVTVRQILQHRSGLPELTDFPEIDEYRAGVQHRTFTPAEEIAIALRHPSQFSPGARFRYTNTNYIVVGMLIEKVTGRAYSDVLRDRILTPNHLADTYLPGAGEADLRGPHPEGYAMIDNVLTDVTRQESSVAWAAGAMVSSGDDLDHFGLALLAGKVVPDAQLREMLDLQHTDDFPVQYGLGIGGAELSCGTQFFGHRRDRRIRDDHRCDP